MTGFNQEIDTAVKKAEDAAGAAEGNSRAGSYRHYQYAEKNHPNGIAGLDGSGKLIQMPTAADVGASAYKPNDKRKGVNRQYHELQRRTSEPVQSFGVASCGQSGLKQRFLQTPAHFMVALWAAWGGGRVPVGVNTADSDFNTVEKQAAKKTEKTPSSKVGYKRLLRYCCG